MAIEKATDQEPGLDDPILLPEASNWDVLHEMIHGATPGLVKQWLTEQKDDTPYEAAFQVKMTFSPDLVKAAFERFMATHENVDLTVAPGAQGYYGGSLSALLSGLSGMAVTVVEPDEADAGAAETPGKKLH